MLKYFFTWILILFYVQNVLLSQELSYDCPPDTISNEEIVDKIEGIYQELDRFIGNLKIIVDPDKNFVEKGNSRKNILQMFKNNNWETKAANIFAYKLQYEPIFKLKPQTMALEEYLDYLSIRHDRNEKVTFQWCLPDQSSIKTIRSIASNNTIVSKCKYYFYDVPISLEEKVTISSNGSSKTKTICKQFNFILRLRDDSDPNYPGETEIVWEPYMKSVTKGKKCSESKIKNCNEVEIKGRIELSDSMLIDGLTFDLGGIGDDESVIPVPETEIFKVVNSRFGLNDKKLVKERFSGCPGDPENCESAFRSFIEFDHNGGFILNEIPDGTYDIRVWVGTADPSIDQAPFSIRIENVTRQDFTVPKGQITPVDFTVDVTDNRLNLLCLGLGDYPEDQVYRICKIRIRDNKNIFDFGSDELVKYGYKSVSEFSPYMKETRFGFLNSRKVTSSVVNTTDSLLGDNLLLEAGDSFRINLARGPYRIDIHSIGEFRGTISGKSIPSRKGKKGKKVEKRGVEFLSEQILVKEDGLLDVVISQNEVRITGIEVYSDEICALSIPWKSYLVPGLSLNHYTKNSSFNLRYWPLIAGTVGYFSIKAIDQSIRAGGFYKEHKEATVLAELDIAYDNHLRVNKRARENLLIAAAIWAGTDLLSFYLDVRNRRRCINGKENKLNVRSTAAVSLGTIQPTILGDNFGALSLGLQYRLNF